MMTFQFKIQIKGITKPPVWRTIKVNSNITFREFHAIIQLAFGWTFSHLYLFSEKGYASQFQIQDKEFADDEYSESVDANQTRLKSIFKKKNQTYTYIYDFGDSWEHKITLEKITDENLLHPICLTGKGKCPPEDCGGVWGYEELKDAINDRSHPEYEELRDWMGLEEGEKWDAAAFDIDKVNKVLRKF
jgi:hypothetical protein